MAASYLKQAEERLRHVKEALGENHAFVIRQSQEAVELYSLEDAKKAFEGADMVYKNCDRLIGEVRGGLI